MSEVEAGRAGESTHVLELLDVSRRFGSEPAVEALVGIDLRLDRGEWLAITGPSGAGKSTLLNILGCLDRPTGGKYFFGGNDTGALSDRERAGLRSRLIGFVFQAFQLLPHRSVLENVMLAEVYRKQSARGRRQRAEAALRRVGLGHRIHFTPPKLSGGEAQRVAIARAIVGVPRVLLCDEPTGNLDSRSTAEILDLFESLNDEGLTLVVVSHDPDVARRASRKIHIVDGRQVEPAGGTRHAGVRDRWVGGPAAATWAGRKRAGSRSGITFRDLFDEAIAGALSRPVRMLLTVLGVAIGLTALVAIVGLTRTGGNQIIIAFDELAATEIRVIPKSGPGGVVSEAIPWDAPIKLARLNGVVAAGTLSEVDVGDTLVSSSPVTDPTSQTRFNLSVKAASPGLFAAVRATLWKGRYFDLGHSGRLDRVALVGPSAARRLGIAQLEPLTAITIGDFIYSVIGVLDEVKREPDLLGSVIIPEGTARRDFNLESPGAVIVETNIGATSLIVRQAALAMRPDDPDVLRLEYPPEPKRVRDAVSGDLNLLLLLLGGLSLVVGAIGIGNITLVSVMERTGEIGLRRAIGATRGHIAAQFFLESTSVGAIGGILGTGVGIAIIVTVSALQTWTPVLDPEIPILAPLLGGGIGFLSGTYPALRAARMEPVEAFRS